MNAFRALFAAFKQQQHRESCEREREIKQQQQRSSARDMMRLSLFFYSYLLFCAFK